VLNVFVENVWHKARLHDRTSCQTGLTAVCIVCTNIEPVVQPVTPRLHDTTGLQPVVLCKRGVQSAGGWGGQSVTGWVWRCRCSKCWWLRWSVCDGVSVTLQVFKVLVIEVVSLWRGECDAAGATRVMSLWRLLLLGTRSFMNVWSSFEFHSHHTTSATTSHVEVRFSAPTRT